MDTQALPADHSAGPTQAGVAHDRNRSDDRRIRHSAAPVRREPGSGSGRRPELVADEQHADRRGGRSHPGGRAHRQRSSRCARGMGARIRQAA